MYLLHVTSTNLLVVRRSKHNAQLVITSAADTGIQKSALQQCNVA